jgi:hypothetical protein
VVWRSIATAYTLWLSRKLRDWRLAWERKGCSDSGVSVGRFDAAQSGTTTGPRSQRRTELLRSAIMKGLAYLIIALFSFAAWQWRKYEARKRLREMDEGKRCINCEKTETRVEHGIVTCLFCHHSEVLANMQMVQLTAEEIDAMTCREHRN